MVQNTTRRPTPRKRVRRDSASTKRAGSPKWLPIGLGSAGIVVVAVIIAVALAPAGGTTPESEGEAGAGPSAATVSFVAVGDNLPDEFIGAFADVQKGGLDDQTYDYRPLFENVKPYIESADLAYIDQETHVGGNDLEPQGYPSFNTTDEMADAVVDAGFDFVASATNHSYDWGSYGALEHSLSVWESKPVAFTGTAVTAEQYERIPVLERNGITFSLLNYTYGVNGYTADELPEYAVNFIDKNRIAADVVRARGMSDVVLVAMHWGTENLAEIDEEQAELAQFLADLDVDVVLGSHPHVIGPMKWVKNSKGGNHETLVAFSLGNFIADHETPLDMNVLEGMLSCDFVRSKGSSEVEVRNVRWTPLVFHSNDERDDFALYAVQDYPAGLAKKNRALTGKKDPLKWLDDTTRRIVGPQWFEERT